LRNAAAADDKRAAEERRTAALCLRSATLCVSLSCQAFSQWRDASIGAALRRRDHAVLLIQSAVRRHWGRRRHRKLVAQERKRELRYTTKDMSLAGLSEKVTQGHTLSHDVQQAAERWQEAAKVLATASEVWRQECPEVYRSRSAGPEPWMNKLEALSNKLKPWQHEHFRNLQSKRGLEEGPTAAWHREANHRLFGRVQRSKILVRAAWGGLPPSVSDGAAEPSRMGIPDLGMPEIRMPDLELKMPWGND